LRDLAARAGVGLGTIFQHFKDKSTLLASVFEHEFQPRVDRAFASVPQEDLKTQLVYLVRKFYTFYATRPHFSRILVKELYIEPENAEKISRLFLRDIARLEALFEAARQRGEIDPLIDIGDAVSLWWSYYSYVLLKGLQMPRFDADEQLEIYKRLMDQHFQGIEGRSDFET
jgi:AcrR family transcriptional regulator